MLARRAASTLCRTSRCFSVAASSPAQQLADIAHQAVSQKNLEVALSAVYELEYNGLTKTVPTGQLYNAIAQWPRKVQEAYANLSKSGDIKLTQEVLRVLVLACDVQNNPHFADDYVYAAKEAGVEIPTEVLERVLVMKMRSSPEAMEDLQFALGDDFENVPGAKGPGL